MGTHRNPDLRGGGVPFANSDGPVLDGLEVNNNSEGDAELVSARVAATNGVGGVVDLVGHLVFAEALGCQRKILSLRSSRRKFCVLKKIT